MKRRVTGSLSVYEKVENMQEKNPAVMDGSEFMLSLKSCFNLPRCALKPKIGKIRVMKNPEDE